MKAELDREALVYILIALAVIYIGVNYATGGNFLSVIQGKNPFAVPEIEVPQGYGFSSSSGAQDYAVTISGLKINYKDGKQPPVAQFYPVLDFGDNPLMDGTKFIECKAGGDKYNCGDQSLTFVLKPESIRTWNNLGKTNTPVQLYFFKKTEAIREYVNGAGNKRTTSNLLATFIDFYLYSVPVGSVDTTGIDAFAQAYCKPKDAEGCSKDENCYSSGSACLPCKTSNSCADYSAAECGKCKFSKLNNCRWRQVGTIFEGESKFECVSY